ncbi:MAG: RusA family crossover junction endodeoxyribonuclease [Candidatus Niameybacter stercoravium]|nr:RusA family crossover junction endodeoxyribonuclease [Candidatus Niameybacter stercoravium]
MFNSLNNIAYADDKQVVDLHIKKLYDTDPRVEVTIYKD